MFAALLGKGLGWIVGGGWKWIVIGIIAATLSAGAVRAVNTYNTAIETVGRQAGEINRHLDRQIEYAFENAEKDIVIADLLIERDKERAIMQDRSDTIATLSTEARALRVDIEELKNADPNIEEYLNTLIPDALLERLCRTDGDTTAPPPCN